MNLFPLEMPVDSFCMGRFLKNAEGGKVYVCKKGTPADAMNKKENFLKVYREEQGENVPVVQPILLNQVGLPVINGNVVNILCPREYALAIYDAYGEQQFYFPNVSKCCDAGIAQSSSVIDASRGATGIQIMHLKDHQMPVGGYFGAQDFAFNENTREVYTLALSGASSGDYAVINTFNMDGGRVVSSTGASVQSKIPGHQGLGVDLSLGTTYLWTTANRDAPSTYTGRHAVKFRFEKGREPYDAVYYKLFGEDFEDSTSCTPAIDPSYQYLAAHGTKVGGNPANTYLRVWRLADLPADGGDISDMHFIDIPTRGLVGTDYPLQGLAIHDGVVVGVSGNASLNQSKKMYWYSVQSGDLIWGNDSFNIGKSQAGSEGTRYEPEGLSFIKDGNDYVLVVGIVSGKSSSGEANRFTRLWMVDKPIERFYRGLYVPYNTTAGAEGGGNLYSGRYTPEVTAVDDNVSSIVVQEHTFTRVGNVITVAGRVDLTPKQNDSLMQVYISLPFATDAKYAYHIVGVAHNNSATNPAGGSIFAHAESDRAQLRMKTTTANTNTVYYTFQYYIL